MTHKSVPMLAGAACLAISLGACATSEGLAPADPAAPGLRVTLPAPSEGVAPCLRDAFPEIADRDLTAGDVVRIIGRAKLLDRQKTACGLRALAWIEAVQADFAKP